MKHKSNPAVLAGPGRIQFDFSIEGHRYRPTLYWIPHEANLRRARAYLARIKAQIAAYQREQRRVNAIEDQPTNALTGLSQIRAV
jgi:hypothetical protein